VRRLLGFHAAALALVLLGLLLLTGTDSVVSADEAAMIAELDLLERTGDWTMPNPEPTVDPDMRALPLELSDRTSDGRWAPFAKHPVHIAVLRPFWAAGGLGGALALSLAGVVVAAVSAAWLAERLRPGSAVAAFWLTGLGSPLLFDGFQVVGHALAAGTFGVAAALLVHAIDDDRRPRAWAAVGGMAVALALTGLVRSEGVLAGIALGVACAAFGVVRRERWPVVVGAVAATVGVAVRLGEPVLVRTVLGAGPADPLPSASAGDSGFVSARWSGFRVSVLDAGYGVDSGEGLLLAALLLAVGAALAWRLRRDGSLVTVLAVAAAVAAVGRMIAADFLVPGLLPALPLLAVALVLVRRDEAVRWPRSVLWAGAGLFAAAVVATQYRTGGTGEWGGRYFAVAVPVIVAVALAAVIDGTDDMGGRTRRVAAACLAVVAATLAFGAVRAVDRSRDAAGSVAQAVVEEVDDLDVEVTVSTRGALSRFAWERALDGRRWMTTDPDAVGPLLERLADDGVTRLALVTGSSEASVDASAVAAGFTNAGEREVRPGTVVALLTR